MQAALDAIQACERILAKLGAEMTCGGELEWYSIVDVPRLPLDVATIKKHIFRNIELNPSLFSELHTLGCTKEAITSCRAENHMNCNEAILFLVKERLDDIPEHDTNEKDLGNLATTLIMTRVVHRAHKAGIAVEACKKEMGHVPSELAVQHELTIKPTHPHQAAIWLETLRTMIKEESRKLETLADFSDKPDYTLGTTHNGSGLHIHYGLRDADSKQNLMHYPTTLGKSLIYSLCADGVLEVARQGGMVLACPFHDSYDRIKSNVSPFKFGEDIDKKTAVRGVTEDLKNLHQELRLPGSSTPASLAVLFATLGVVYGIAEELEIGRNIADRVDPWRRHLDRGHKGLDMLASIEAAITPAIKKRFKELCQMPTKEYILDKGEAPISLSEAIQQAHAGSILSSYCPTVLRELTQQRASVSALA